MAGPQDDSKEIESLKAQIAALTARVSYLEQVIAAALTKQSHPHLPTASAAGTAQPRASEQIGSATRPADALETFARGEINLEKKIGQHWLNRIGIVAMLFGISYFLKYAFENNWIGSAGRVGIGLLSGVALLIWSERFMRRGYKAFSYSLKALGIGILYLSLWAAFQVYRLVPASASFAAMIAVTSATTFLALIQDAELLAAFALAGGFLTPLLLSTGRNHEAILFTYVCLLDIAVLVITFFKLWRRLLWGAFAGTFVLYFAWSVQFYSRDQRPLTVFFAAMFGLIFAAMPLATKPGPGHFVESGPPSLTLILLSLLNPAIFFLLLYGMYERETPTLASYALALSVVYTGISRLFNKRFPHQDNSFFILLHISVAATFLTIAIPLGLNTPWVTIGWLVESGALVWLSATRRIRFLAYLAAAALGLGIVRLLFFDRFHTQTLIFNARFATYLVAIAVLAGIARFARPPGSGKESPLLGLAVVTMNLLALVALTWEASDYFDRLLAAGQVGAGNVGSIDARLARDFSYSAIWLVYGVMLMVVGFRKRSAFVRWQSLVLIAVTIVKVFLYDVAALNTGYRILSFVALGAVLLAISFVYQRDWLKLSTRAPEKPAGQTSRS